MNETLKEGLTSSFRFTIPDNKIVASLYPESEEFQQMPKVFATGFMVGLIEWACIKAVNPFIDWPNQQTVGTHINVSHISPTPPGLSVTVTVVLEKVEGRRLLFSVKAKDDSDLISEGTHERFIINADSFNKKVLDKSSRYSL